MLDTHDNKPVLGVAEMQQLEQQIVDSGTPLLELMQRAGHSVSAFLVEKVPASGTAGASFQVVVFSGSGNNGGDGWVVADDLASEGYQVALVTPRPADELTAEPAKTAALQAMAKQHATLSVFVAPDRKQIGQLLGSCLWVVDAILGIGFDGGTVKEPYASWINEINAVRRSRTLQSAACTSGACSIGTINVGAATGLGNNVQPLQIVAVDIPSGLSAQTGAAAAPSIFANATITMLAYKPGLLTGDAWRQTGPLTLAELTDITPYLNA